MTPARKQYLMKYIVYWHPLAWLIFFGWVVVKVGMWISGGLTLELGGVWYWYAWAIFTIEYFVPNPNPIYCLPRHGGWGRYKVFNCTHASSRVFRFSQFRENPDLRASWLNSSYKSKCCANNTQTLAEMVSKKLTFRYWCESRENDFLFVTLQFNQYRSGAKLDGQVSKRNIPLLGNYKERIWKRMTKPDLLTFSDT